MKSQAKYVLLRWYSQLFHGVRGVGRRHGSHERSLARRDKLGSDDQHASGGARQLSSSYALVRDEQCAMMTSVEELVEAGKAAAGGVSCGGAMQHQISFIRMVFASLQPSCLKAVSWSP